MPKHKTVFIVGLENVGKTTFAHMLQSEFGYREIAFADNLKKAAYDTNPYLEGGMYLADAVDRLGWEATKDEIEGARRFLEDFANKGIKDNFGQYFWADQVLNKISGAPSERWAVSDLRFDEELHRAVELLGRENIITIKIVRGQEPKSLRRSQIFAKNHQADYTIDNNGTLDELREQVRKLRKVLS